MRSAPSPPTSDVTFLSTDIEGSTALLLLRDRHLLEFEGRGEELRHPAMIHRHPAQINKG